MSKVYIHKTAEIHPSSSVGLRSTVGAHSVIGPNVVIGDDVTIGALTVVGGIPESRDFHTEPINMGVRIEGNAYIGDLVKINSGTVRTTVIFGSTIIYSGATIGHDCLLGGRAVVSAGARIGGHASIYPYANLGLNATVHQFARIGFGSMIGMGGAVRGRVGNFQTLAGNPLRLIGRNVRMATHLGTSPPLDSFSEEDLIKALEGNEFAIHALEVFKLAQKGAG